VLRLLLLSSVDFTIISLGIGILFQLATGLFGFIAGPQAVFDLGIFMRLMQSYGALIIAFTYPLSNIIASHLASRHDAAALHTARLSGALLLGAAGVAAIGFLAFANEILSFWLRTPIRLDSLFLSCAALLIILSALHFYAASLLIGTSDTKAVARIHLGEAIAFTPFAFALFFELGEGGVLLALDLTLAAGLFLMMQRVLAHRALGAFFSPTRVKAA
jgi:O-antigen/teichoic acid export membrane protein